MIRYPYKGFTIVDGTIAPHKGAEGLKNPFDYSMAICKVLTPPSQLHVTSQKRDAVHNCQKIVGHQRLTTVLLTVRYYECTDFTGPRLA
jgi:hypothetical protein